jgi:hypothetical protein
MAGEYLFEMAQHLGDEDRNNIGQQLRIVNEINKYFNDINDPENDRKQYIATQILHLRSKGINKTKFFNAIDFLGYMDDKITKLVEKEEREGRLKISRIYYKLTEENETGLLGQKLADQHYINILGENDVKKLQKILNKYFNRNKGAQKIDFFDMKNSYSLFDYNVYGGKFKVMPPFLQENNIFVRWYHIVNPSVIKNQHFVNLVDKLL